MGPEVMSIKGNVEYICRICLTAGGSFMDMVALFDSMTDTVATMYIKCTSLPADRTDGISEYICSKCYKNLVDFHAFRVLCINSYNFFIERHPENRIEIKKSDPDDTDWSSTFIKEEPNNQFEDHVEEYDVKYKDDVVDTLSEHENNPIPEIESIHIDKKKETKRPTQPKKKKKAPKTDRENALSCDICQKIFFKKHRLEGHLRKHLGLKPFQCNLCEDKQFSKWFTYKEHINLKHTKGTERVQYKCDFDGCNKSYFIKDSLQMHIKMKHLGIPQKTRAFNFVCEHCGKSFKSNETMKKHWYTHVPELMPYICKICPRKFPTKHKLKEHTMRHEGIKNHVCTLCGLRKTTGHELKVHMRNHTKDKVYTCEFCPKIFSNMTYLTQHVKVVHRGVKEFKCTLCDKSFARSETLKHHTMTHTGKF